MKTITPSLKRILKKPMGNLYSFRSYSKLFDRLKNRFVCAVGDATVARLSSLGIPLDVAVYDMRIRRKPSSMNKRVILEKLPGVKFVCVNPAGKITPSLENAVCLALSTGTASKIFVKGEEDLAVIPLLRTMTHGCVCYGQPGKGVVVLDVNRKTKALAETYYAAFKDAPSKKKTVLFPGRFQPFHNGHARILSRLLSQFDRVIVVIGSGDLSDKHNPYSPAMRKKMIRACFPKSKNLFFAVISFARDADWINTLLKKVSRRRFDLVFTNNLRVQKQLAKAGISFISGPLYRRNVWQGRFIRKKKNVLKTIPNAVLKILQSS